MTPVTWNSNKADCGDKEVSGPSGAGAVEINCRETGRKSLRLMEMCYVYYGSGYRALYICHNSSKCTFKIIESYCM